MKMNKKDRHVPATPRPQPPRERTSYDFIPATEPSVPQPAQQPGPSTPAEPAPTKQP